MNAQEKQRVLRVLDDLLAEEQEEKFLLYNMNIYLAMQLHALYCRYAMERKKKEDSEKRLCMGCYSKGAVGYKQNSTNGRVCQSGRDDNGNIES